METVATWMNDPIVQAFVDTLIKALATAVAALAILVLKRLAARFGLALSIEQEEAVRGKVRDVILQIEEIKRQQLAAGHVEMPPVVARERAIDMIQQEYPKLSEEEVIAKVHAELPIIRKQIGQVVVLPKPPDGTDR